MTKIVKNVESQEMAALFVLDVNYERSPLPIRMQPRLRLKLPFTEYVKFVSELSPRNVLASNDAKRALALSRYNTDKVKGYRGLFACYGTDVCFALIKELNYAGFLGKEATEIIPACDYSGAKVTPSTVETNFEKIRSVTEPIIRAMMLERGYNANVLQTVDTRYSYKLANVLLFYATNDIVWHYSD